MPRRPLISRPLHAVVRQIRQNILEKYAEGQLFKSPLCQYSLYHTIDLLDHQRIAVHVQIYWTYFYSRQTIQEIHIRTANHVRICQRCVFILHIFLFNSITNFLHSPTSLFVQKPNLPVSGIIFKYSYVMSHSYCILIYLSLRFM